MKWPKDNIKVLSIGSIGRAKEFTGLLPDLIDMFMAAQAKHSVNMAYGILGIENFKKNVLRIEDENATFTPEMNSINDAEKLIVPATEKVRYNIKRIRTDFIDPGPVLPYTRYYP